MTAEAKVFYTNATEPKTLQPKYCPFMRSQGTSIPCLHQDCALFHTATGCLLRAALEKYVEELK